MAPRKKKTDEPINNKPIKENIKTIGYNEEMETSYRDYALSVIVARAIPDVRDGLKPVQRRTIYAMEGLGINHDKPYKKSARIVGEAMGKYHPHGDSSIYEAMVHMGQDWNYPIPLVDCHGNFGSIEGDGPAAMRYCVTGDTLINTDKGLIKIKDIVKNTELNSDNDIDITIKSKDSKQNKAIKLFNSGKHNTYTITLENGMEITGTSNHPLLISNNKSEFAWKTISELTIGDNCVIDIDISNAMFGDNNNLQEAKTTGMTLSKTEEDIPEFVFKGTKEYLMEFIKYLTKNNNSRLLFSSNNKKLVQQLQIILATLFGYETNIRINNNKYELNVIKNNSQNKYTFSPIKSIKENREEVVYSLKVDSECHSFIGNGFVNHNTEARLSKFSEECLLQDLNPGIVPFIPNFDETETEPLLFPARVPNILISGTTGIAVGMATNIPSHNFNEVIDGTIEYMKNPKITTEELMNYIKGPDFATGGIISNKSDLLNIYETGVGKVRIRGKVETEPAANGKTNIVITEIPFPMIGAIDKFMETVADLVRKKAAPDITDISNQSSKEGIRIVVELRKGADVQKNINLLYKKARLEDTFGVIMLAIKDQEPIVFSLKQILKEFVDFQMDIYQKKYNILLAKAIKEKELKEGLIKACDIIDLIIEILRGSKTTKQAKECLMSGRIDGINFKTKKSQTEASKLSFTEIQAQAILDMKLQRLIGLEIDALKKELATCLKNIKTYESILSSPTKMKNTIKNDLIELKEKGGYSSPRKTEIIDAEAIVLQKEELVEQDYVVLEDRFGYVKLIDMPTYERNKESIPNDFKFYSVIKNTDKLLIFTEDGKMHSIKALDIPLGKYKDKGTPLDNLCNYKSSESMIALLTTGNEVSNKKLLFVNSSGLAKQVDGSNFIVSKKTIDATKLADKETVKMISVLNDEKEIVISSKSGNYIRFKIEEIPEKGKPAAGVRCIKLKDGDIVENVYIGDSKTEINFNDKETIPFSRVKISKRDGVGTKIRL